MWEVNLIILCCTFALLPETLGGESRMLKNAKILRLGGVFEKNDPSQDAFTAAVETINGLRNTDKHLSNSFFKTDIYEIDDDLYETGNKVCDLLRSKTVAIFGPSGKKSGEHVRHICDNVEIPNIVARRDNEPIKMTSFNFFPQADLLAKVFLRIVSEFKWKAFTILYDGSDSLVHMHELLKKWNPKGHTVTIRHLGNGSHWTDFRDILLDVKKSSVQNIVIDCSYDILNTVLVHAQQVGLMSDRYSILITNLDLHTIDLEPYRYSGVNLTGVRLVDVGISDPHERYKTFLDKLGLDRFDQLRVQAALMFDAVKFFSRALRRSLRGKDDEIRALKCNGTDYWDFGIILGNYIRTTESKGLTGVVKLNSYGFREDFEIDIISLRRKGIRKIGTFSSTLPLPSQIIWDYDDENVPELQNKTFRVLIALVRPYNMYTNSANRQTGNERYEGFAIDIIKEISKILHFNYTFIETDTDYGKMINNVTKKWSGMIGKILEDEADLAITDLTITAERERVVDFTMPFLNLGISILYRKPTKAAPSLFSFLSPFATTVWVYLLISYIFCSLLMCLIGRMSPKEWTNPYPCIDEPEVLQNQFTLKNSLWFMIGAIMQQGSEIAPIGLSTRMLASAWWFFCLIIVSSYTANLAAFLVVETPEKIIKTADDLANLNGEIKYGAKKNGATFDYFKVNDYPTYKKMYEYMVENSDKVMTETNDAGIKKAMDIHQNYAFLMESSSIRYITERQCNLTQIGDLLDQKGYGIAMRKNAPYRGKFNSAVLHLQETGVLEQLRMKWWEQKGEGAGQCKGEQSPEASKLTLNHVGGVFVVLGIGVAVAIPFAFWEFIWHVITIAFNENLSFKEVFVTEIRSIIKAKSSVKPARGRKDSSRIMNSRGSTPGEYNFGPNVITTPP